MATSVPLHVVSKHENGKNAILHTTDTRESLQPESVRVKARLISLSSNNLTYACFGSLLHLWDAFPVPKSTAEPEPSEDWGIVPAWGYAIVIESVIESIPKGSTLWGYWPTSPHAVDLKLAPGVVAGQWTEVSPGRKRLMTAYNQYRQVDVQKFGNLEALTALCKPLRVAAYLLNAAVFNPKAPIPPAGTGQWTAADADLSSAVVVALAASSKTGRAFAWELLRNRPENGPLALLQVTSTPTMLQSHETGHPTRVVDYGSLSTAVPWITSLSPSRIVVVDFGAAPEVVEELVSLIPAGIQIALVAVGLEAKAYTDIELKKRMEVAQKLQMVQFNGSDVRDAVMKGREVAYYYEVEESWNRCLVQQGMGEVGFEAVQGAAGMEIAWQKLCEGKVKGGSGYVVSFD